MITFPAGFDFSLLIADLMTFGIPIVGIAFSICVYRIISHVLSDGSHD